MTVLLAFLFGCRHRNISWPQYGHVQCLDCCQRLVYDWREMRVSQAAPSAGGTEVENA